MSFGIIVSGLKLELPPRFGFEIGDRVERLGGETEQPMAGRIGRHEKLINLGNREGGFDFLVSPFHLPGVTRIVGTFMLVD